MKSASASVGALAVAAAAARIEQALRGGVAPAPDMAEQLQHEIERLARAMDALRPLRFAGVETT